MQASELPLTLLKIPNTKQEQLRKKGFQSLEDLVRFYPRRYENRGRIVEWDKLDAHIGRKTALIGVLQDVYVDYQKNYMSCRLADPQNDERNISVTWFHQNYRAKQLKRGSVYFVFGKLTYNEKFGFQITDPISFEKNSKKSATPLPVYPAVPGMSAEYLSKCISQAMIAIEKVGIDDPMDEEFRNAIGVEGILPFLKKIHEPQNMEDVRSTSMRMAADLMLPFAVEMMKRKHEVSVTTKKTVPKDEALSVLNQILQKLPFDLTEDQKKAVFEMTDCVCQGKRLSALIQGDVGCGKTVIAELIAAVMAKGGYQVAVMAPTSILATQHYSEFQKLFDGAFRIGFLGGKMKAKEKRELLAAVENGEIDIVIGTHAIVSDDLKFKNLGLTIVDEEHRFGVDQRQKLREKAAQGAHSISMSATPIPRSLALAIFGDDLTIYSVRTMPAGRKPVQTIAYSNEIKTYMSAYKQIKQGRQAYVICPLIEDSDSSTMENVDSVKVTEQTLQKFFSRFPEVRIATITGKMKEADIQNVIREYAAGKYDILLSTTIVEVGVNVPNATVMIIKNAERFGLAQLHQLRGRVGRSAYQSYCVLLSQDIENPRIQTMVETNDGFAIAEADLKLRGAGNLVGTEQSGNDDALAAILQHPELYRKMMDELQRIFDANDRYLRYRAMVN